MVLLQFSTTCKYRNPVRVWVVIRKVSCCYLCVEQVVEAVAFFLVIFLFFLRVFPELVQGDKLSAGLMNAMTGKKLNDDVVCLWVLLEIIFNDVVDLPELLFSCAFIDQLVSCVLITKLVFING